MNRSKLKDLFGNIDNRVFEKLSSKERQPIAKYNNMMRYIRRWEDEILKKEDEINYLKSRIKGYEKDCKKMFKLNKHLENDYNIKYNVSTNNKRLKDGSISIYWMINLKYRGLNKAIYLGSDKNVKQKIKEELGLEEELKKDDIKNKIAFLCFDNLLDMVLENKNLFDKKITFDDLI